MELQKEIEISQFENIYQQAMVNVVFTSGWCNDQLKKVLVVYEITNQQFNILRILRGQYPDPSTINLLKTRMLDKMCDASRIVDRLVQKGHVMKSIRPSDKRAVDIRITKTGLALLRQIDEEVELSSIISPNLTADETGQLNRLLDKMRG